MNSPFILYFTLYYIIYYINSSACVQFTKITKNVCNDRNTPYLHSLIITKRFLLKLFLSEKNNKKNSTRLPCGM